MENREDSVRDRREMALKFCYGYYIMLSSDEVGSIQNGLSMACDPRPLSNEEKASIVGLIKRDREVRAHYIYFFEEEGRCIF